MKAGTLRNLSQRQAPSDVSNAARILHARSTAATPTNIEAVASWVATAWLGPALRAPDERIMVNSPLHACRAPAHAAERRLDDRR